MSNEIQNNVVLDKKYFKEKVYHEGITIIVTKGCKDEHVKKTIDCLSHIQELFKARKINVPLSRIFKLYGQLPDTNFFNKTINTINWLLYNSIQRIFKIEKIDKNNIDYLKKSLNYSKVSD